MIIEVPGPLKNAAFVTSDRKSLEMCRREIAQWLARFGYTAADPGRVFSIFKDGRVVREWHIALKGDPRSPHH